MTKEVIVIRMGSKAHFDQFYLLWALSLKVVRDQWKRVVFMQTNREDVGDRFFEILLPVPPNKETADKLSSEFSEYYRSLAASRSRFSDYLNESGQHHFFLSGAGNEAQEVE